MDDFSILPFEILEKICCYLPAVSRVALSKTCRRLRTIVHHIEAEKPEMAFHMNLCFLEKIVPDGEDVPDSEKTICAEFLYYGSATDKTTNSLKGIIFSSQDKDLVLQQCQRFFDQNCNITSFGVRVKHTPRWKEMKYYLPHAQIDAIFRSLIMAAVNSAMFCSKLSVSLDLAPVDGRSFMGNSVKQPYFRMSEVNQFFANCSPLAHYHIGTCGVEAFKFITTNPSRLQNVSVELELAACGYGSGMPGNMRYIPKIVDFFEDCLSGQFPTDYDSGRSPIVPDRCKLLVNGFGDNFLEIEEKLMNVVKKHNYRFVPGSSKQPSCIEGFASTISWSVVVERYMDILIEKRIPQPGEKPPMMREIVEERYY